MLPRDGIHVSMPERLHYLLIIIPHRVAKLVHRVWLRTTDNVAV